MKTEILTKLEKLLENENIFAIQQEFKQLAAQFRNLIEHGVSETEHGEHDEEDDEDDQDNQHVSNSKSVEPNEVLEEKGTDEAETSENPISEKVAEDKAAETSVAMGSVENETKGDPDTKSVTTQTEPPTSTDDSEEQMGGNESESFKEAKAHFESIVETFKQRLEKARLEKKKIEEETVSTAKDLLEELQKLVENEENIGKAFNGFNAIQEKWKSLPRVGNDSYRDLNIEYNKFAEQFFYNINIYKELKELDLKHNLEQKLLVIEDQKKLLEINDIRLMEVEVRLNQDRWNEIGPTFKEEWDKIKDEFWNITRGIYKKIQDFYNERREQQEKNFELKQDLLNKLNHILSLNLQSHKKWQIKTAEVIDLQKQWKMIGYVPKDKASFWKEFRNGCDKFFEAKRLYLREERDVQNTNKEAKQKLLDEAESLKDSDDWKETSHKLINLQKEWKKIGPANQRDENKLWRKFREACDTFFLKRKNQKADEINEQKANLISKQELLKELESFEPGKDAKDNVENLKAFSARWRDIGHVPFKAKDEINKEYKRLLDTKFSSLKIDKKQKEKIRFEQKLEDIRDRDDNDYLIRKEQDTIRSKIGKLKNEIIQFENNMGFFASSKEASKLKEEVGQKVIKLENEIATLKERLSLLRDA